MGEREKGEDGEDWRTRSGAYSATKRLAAPFAKTTEPITFLRCDALGRLPLPPGPLPRCPPAPLPALCHLLPSLVSTLPRPFSSAESSRKHRAMSPSPSARYRGCYPVSIRRVDSKSNSKLSCHIHLLYTNF